MRFYHPEILTLLFLLIIPILIHLFQLQRFKTETFTNVKFLREIELESRKSSRIKKLLILASRLLAMACLILAFAQPYFQKNKRDEGRNTLIYVDNSLSLQAKEKDGGEMLQFVKSSLLEDLRPLGRNYTLITNNDIFSNLESEGLKREILDIDYYPIQKSLSQVLLEAMTLQGDDIEQGSDIFLFSDFRKDDDTDSLASNKSDQFYIIPVRPGRLENLILDSLWMGNPDENEIKLKARISSQGMNVNNLSVSLILNDKLYGKTTVNGLSGESFEVEFKIPPMTTGNGVLTFNDQRIGFDNTLFFTLPQKVKSRILVIGKESSYLRRIYNEEAFDLSFRFLEDLDQGMINEYDLVITNEMKSIPLPLAQSLKAYVQLRGNLVIIPAQDAELFSYRQFFAALGIGEIRGEFDREKLITTVSYEHPFFNNVFRGRVTNFQYPQVSWGIETSLYAASPLLLFEDKSSFISEIPVEGNSIYWIASPLDTELSNFSESPLIVPVFYNFSIRDRKAGALYYLLGLRNELVVKNDSLNESPVKIIQGEEEYIPLQKNRFNEASLYLEDYPLTPGIYELKQGSSSLTSQAFNYDRKFIKSEYKDLDVLKSSLPNSRVVNSVKDGVQEVNELFSSRNLWQLFIIFALIFLGIEMAIQRFLKN